MPSEWSKKHSKGPFLYSPNGPRSKSDFFGPQMRRSHERLLSARKSKNEKIKSSGWTLKLPTLREIKTSNNKKKVPIVITEENNKPKLKMRRMVLKASKHGNIPNLFNTCERFLLIWKLPEGYRFHWNGHTCPRLAITLRHLRYTVYSAFSIVTLMPTLGNDDDDDKLYLVHG